MVLKEETNIHEISQKTSENPRIINKKLRKPNKSKQESSENPGNLREVLKNP
jgi:hypothetical protein